MLGHSQVSTATVSGLLAPAIAPVEMSHNAWRLLALETLADTISWSLGVPLVAVSAIMDTMPADYLPMLDDYEGWWHIAEMVADQLGHSDTNNPVLPDAC